MLLFVFILFLLFVVLEALDCEKQRTQMELADCGKCLFFKENKMDSECGN